MHMLFCLLGISYIILNQNPCVCFLEPSNPENPKGKLKREKELQISGKLAHLFPQNFDSVLACGNELVMNLFMYSHVLLKDVDTFILR